jgi:type III secretion protein F
MATSYTPTNSLSFGDVETNVLKNADTKEGDLLTQIKALGDSPSTMDMLLLQERMQQWSMLIDLQATIVKTMSDTMKGIIQKSG